MRTTSWRGKLTAKACPPPLPSCCQGIPALNGLATTIEIALVRLSGLLIAMFCLLSLFAGAGIIVFGSQMEEFSDFPAALRTTAIVFATADTSTYEHQNQIDPWAATIWHWLLMAVMFFTLMNMVLAVLVDAYTDAMEAMKASPTTSLLEVTRHSLAYYAARILCRLRNTNPVATVHDVAPFGSSGHGSGGGSGGSEVTGQAYERVGGGGGGADAAATIPASSPSVAAGTAASAMSVVPAASDATPPRATGGGAPHGGGPVEDASMRVARQVGSALEAMEGQIDRMGGRIEARLARLDKRLEALEGFASFI